VRLPVVDDPAARLVQLEHRARFLPREDVRQLIRSHLRREVDLDLNEELHRERDPEVADALRDYYTALIPSPDQPEIGPEGLPVIYRYVHMRDVTIMSSGHKVKVPYWRGQVNQVSAFVIGATSGE